MIPPSTETKKVILLTFFWEISMFGRLYNIYFLGGNLGLIFRGFHFARIVSGSVVEYIRPQGAYLGCTADIVWKF